MNSTVIKCLIGISFFILAGVLGYHLFPSTTSSKVYDNSESPVLTNIRVDTPVTAVREPKEDATGSETVDAGDAKLTTPEPLRYVSLQTQDSSGDMQACMEFNSSFDEAKESALKPFVRISPETPFSIDARGPRLCLLGLDYGRSYEVEILKGLTADTGQTLSRTEMLTVTFEDKPSFVGFAGDGIILPETKGARLTLKTVNVDKLSLKLFRVNDRILSQHSPDSGDSGTADDYVSTYDANSRRTEVWSGDLDITPNRNEVVETAFDLQEKIGDKGLGAYILIAEHIVEGEPEYRRAKAMRWLISTDLALSTYEGSDVLHISVRSIKSATLKAGVRLDLIASNNEKLAEVITDSQGRAVFGKALLSGTGPLSPRMIMAYGADGDYAVLDMSRAPLDLSTMDVQGRSVFGPFDLYAFTDRGIYRPGQSIRLTTLLRDSNAVAIEGRNLTLRVLRPDGTEEEKRTLSDDKFGGYVETIDLPAQASRGSWSLEIGVEGTDTAIVKTVSVEDFVPQRLKLSLKPEDQPVLAAGETRNLTLDAQFYYGAPGSNLETEAELRVQRDPNPFPDFKAYRFGDVTESFRERYVDVTVPMTDDDGQGVAKLRLDKSDTTSSFPLRASFIAGVAEPGGRYVRENVFIPVRDNSEYVGFKSTFGARAERRKPAPIELVSLSSAGDRVESEVTWTLNREDRDYSWYRYRNRWQYRNRTTDFFISDGTLTIGADAPAIWSQALDWGRYRLDVKTKNGETASFRFGVGWSNWGDSDSDAPDRIIVGATDLPTQPGGAMTLNLKSPYSGRGDIVIADHTVRSIRTVEIPEGASSVRIPYDKNWGHDVYAMVTLYTPLDEKKRQGVKRAVGLTHIGLDRSSQTLDVSFDIPDRVQPRTTLEIPVVLSGAPNVKKAWVSLAAVDEGILALTDFDSPDAPAAFFSKKAFALDIHDDYSRMLNPYAADGKTRSGGDSIGGAGLSVVPTKTVALFEGPVDVRNGKATVSLALPDFNGELRIMATAWTKAAIGSVSQSIKVRDAVPANLALPRFLAPGDQAVATLSLDNIDGAPGTYRAAAAGEGLIKATQSAFDLLPGTRDQTGLQIRALDIGIYELSTKISGPQDYSVNSTYPIQVRSPYRPVTRRQIETLEPGESYALNTSILDGYSQKGADINLSVSRLPGLSVTPYLASLNRYPYGCTEQTVSKAMPLLYVGELGGLRDTSAADLRMRIHDAIEKVGSRQSVTGEFGLWREGDGNLSPWLQLYVAEFLVEANEKGFDVSSQSLTSALNTARMLSRMEDYSSLNLSFPNADTRKAAELQRAERAAYAHYVLALADKPDASGIRYLDKAFGDKLSDPISLSYLGAALARIGDEARASVNYNRAYDRIGDERKYNYYSSPERDAAALLAIGGQTLKDDIREKILITLSGLEAEATSTQEKSYIVRAMANLGTSQETISASAKGLTLSNNSVAFLGSALNDNMSVTNTSQSRAYLTLDVTSTPIQSPETLAAGFSISKSLYSLSGDVLSGEAMKKGDRAIVYIEAKAKFRADKMVVLADLLPAGFEIETLLTDADTNSEGRFSFLKNLSDFDMQEARDDRYIASDRRTRWDRDDNTFRAAYIVRAVTAGTFTFPGAVIEDMYRPARVATTEHKTLQIMPSGDF
ncbi:MAG: alpha-2-macroglobulin [Litorimonas sp.]